MNKKFPIYRDANQLIIDTELTVRQFPRYHKYTLGSEMRSSAYTILENISLAINQPISMIKDKKDLIQQAHRETEKFKIKIQLAKSLNLYTNFKSFETIARGVVSVSKQCFAWQYKLQHHKMRQQGL